MDYADTSLLVAALTHETATGRAQSWLESRAGGELMVSEWTVTEVSSALSLKLRTGDLTPEQRSAVLSQFHRILAESVVVAAVESLHFRMAARFADQHLLNVRSGDALHLAVAFDHGATVHTLDGRMAAAGPALGVETRLLT